MTVDGAVQIDHALQLVDDGLEHTVTVAGARPDGAIATARDNDALSRSIEVHSATVLYWARDYRGAAERCAELVRMADEMNLAVSAASAITLDFGGQTPDNSPPSDCSSWVCRRSGCCCVSVRSTRRTPSDGAAPRSSASPPPAEPRPTR
mgnify:CR=1 FL=1